MESLLFINVTAVCMMFENTMLNRIFGTKELTRERRKFITRNLVICMAINEEE
jgi:hypothetical protein